MPRKKIQDQKRVKNASTVEAMKKAGHAGIAQGALTEAVPDYENAPSEIQQQGPNNTFIIQGRDRPGNLYSGFGGRGGTQCGRIDLIAGLGSSYRNKNGQYGPPNNDTRLNPNFAQDAARVYISQKANIDKYMGLAAAPRDESKGRSAVGIKADCVRIHGRSNIKIVTGRQLTAGTGADGERLSTGGPNETVGTISFIAGNYSESKPRPGFNFLNPLKRTVTNKKKLQPLIMGDNLTECLSDIVNAIRDLSHMVGANQTMISNLDISLAAHSHPIAAIPPGIPVAGPVSTHAAVAATIEPRVILNKANKALFTKKLEFIKIEYLNKLGANNIRSNYVFTT